SVSQTIDAMVKADPQLAWLKDAEARGDVDWRRVKEIHESFKYSNSGLGPASQMIIAIVMAAVVGPAALTAMSGMGTFWAASYAAVATGAATNAATSFINNGGNLGAVFKDVTSSDALAGYVISGVTAGLTAGYFDSILKTTTNPITGQVMTDLSSLEGIGRFAGNQLLQNMTSTVLGATFGQHADFGNALTGALLSTLNAAAFNAVGDFAAKQGWKDGSLEKIALHAVVGGLLTEAAGGDFKTGALAAGANEALVTQLATLVKNDSNLLSMSSQLVGIAAAAVSDGNLQEGATIAKDATNYNYLMHHEIVEMLDEQAKCASETCKAEVRERYANLDEQRNAELGSLCQKNLSACKQLSDQLLADQPKIRELAEQLRLSGDICAAANVGWIITENNQTAQNTIIREIVVQRDGESAAFWADAAGVAADVAGGGKPGGSKGTTKNSASHSPDVDGNLGGSGGVKGAGDIVVRSDDDFSATVNGNGKPKAHLNENGDLVPPNIDGTGSVQSHVRGGNAENSPYISVTDPSTTSNPKDYGTNKIEIDVKRLQQDIDSGVLPNTKFLTNQEVTTELQTKVDAARDKFTNNPTPKNQTSLDRAETDLASAARDGECLIKGCVPADYIKPVKK
ncbi:DUF637 domain-containing protein, partial [Pseudomonas moraviensis]|uniref:DUF637 domain-containing protein n=4 Tax=Pseudomonas TaxID=286 RepID=UPI0018D86166